MIQGQMEFYRQCALKRGSTSQVAWIPEEFARVGKVLRIKEQDGWMVLSVSPTRESRDVLSDREREHIHHRSVTDV